MKNNKKKKTELKNINIELKKQIKDILLKISNFLIKNKKVENQKKKIYNSDYDYLNNNLILSELPIDQQISIYQDSISTLQKKIYKIEEYNKIIALNSNEEIFDINQKVNEIKIKKEKLYNIQKENNILLNVYNNNKKVYDSFEMNQSTKYFINEMKKKIQISKEDLKNKKNELRESELEIRKMGKNIIILENNIKIIKDNIEFKKLNEKKILNHTQKSEQINEVKKLQKKIDEIERNINNKNDNYIKAIKNQQNKKHYLTELINIINEDYNRQLNNKRLSRIKSMGKIRVLRYKNMNKFLPNIINGKNNISQKVKRPHSTYPLKRKLNLKSKELKNNDSLILPKIYNGNEKK